MRGTGKRTNFKVKAHTTILTDLSIRGLGSIINRMGMECLTLSMELSMRESGRIMYFMGLGFSLTIRVRSGRVSSGEANSKVRIRMSC